MDKSRKYLNLECTYCSAQYVQQSRVYAKSVWAGRCPKHRKDMEALNMPKIHIPKVKTNTCLDCTKLVRDESIRCTPCANRYRAKPVKHCVDCGVPIHKNATRCKPCVDTKQTIHGENRGRFQASKAWANVRLQAFLRDDRTCQHCGYKGSNIQAHHIKHYADYPTLRLIVSNLTTLCVACHNKLHSLDVGSQRKNSKLIESQVVEIHALLLKGVPQVKIGKIFNVSQGTIQSIKVGRTWRHVKI